VYRIPVMGKKEKIRKGRVPDGVMLSFLPTLTEEEVMGISVCGQGSFEALINWFVISSSAIYRVSLIAVIAAA
jgi:hypothetical protein